MVNPRDGNAEDEEEWSLVAAVIMKYDLTIYTWPKCEREREEEKRGERERGKAGGEKWEREREWYTHIHTQTHTHTRNAVCFSSLFDIVNLACHCRILCGLFSDSGKALRKLLAGIHNCKPITFHVSHYINKLSGIVLYQMLWFNCPSHLPNISLKQLSQHFEVFTCLLCCICLLSWERARGMYICVCVCVCVCVCEREREREREERGTGLGGPGRPMQEG